MLEVMDRLERFYGPLPHPPEDPFALYVWDVLGVRTTAARRDAAMGALRRIPALTPDSMGKVARAKLEKAIALAGPYRRGATSCAHLRRRCVQAQSRSSQETPQRHRRRERRVGAAAASYGDLRAVAAAVRREVIRCSRTIRTLRGFSRGSGVMPIPRPRSLGVS